MTVHLLDFRNNIISHLQGVFPKLHVSAYQGRFNVDELKRVNLKLPALQVAILGSQKIEVIETEERDIHLQLAAFIITHDQKRLKREEAVLAIVERLALLIPYQRWNDAHALPATTVQIENLFSSQMDKQGVALWAVSWAQSLRLGDDIWQQGALPDELYTEAPVLQLNEVS